VNTRLENLQKVMDNWGIVPDDYDEDCEEDLRPYFADDAEEGPGQWCAVTEHDSKVFLYPAYPSKESAVWRLEEYVADDIYAETPVGVFDLDTGDFFRVGRVRVSLMEKSVWNLNEVRA